MTGRLRNPEFVGWLLLAAAVAVAAAFIFWVERGLTFGWDEFVWLEIGGLAPVDYFLQPYGGHLIVFPYLLWRGMLDLFGASFTAFSIVQVAGLSLSATLLYVYGKRRLGPLLALGPAVVLLFLGGSYPVLMEPMIGIQFLAASVPGLAAILLLEREDLAGDVAACALLCLAFAGFSQALPFVVGAVVAVALSPNWKRRIWAVAIPIVAYGIWRQWASQFGSTGIIESNILPLPAYFVDALAVFTSAVFGLATEVGAGPWSKLRIDGYEASLVLQGIVLAVAELIAIGVAIWTLRRRGPIPRTFWPALAMLIAFAVELGVILVPGRTAAEPRYLYGGVLLLLLVVIELARGVRTTRLTVAVALVLTAVAVVGNLARFHEARQYLDAFQKYARADMTVIQLAGENADQAFTPNVDLPGIISGGLVLNTGPWLLVVDRYGSVANSIPELRDQPEEVREQADLVARRALRLKLAKVPATAARGCARVSAGLGPTDVVLPRGGARLKASRDSEVGLRRWADHFSVPLEEVRAGGAVVLRIPPDPSHVPWRLRFQSGGPVEVCALG